VVFAEANPILKMNLAAKNRERFSPTPKFIFPQLRKPGLARSREKQQSRHQISLAFTPVEGCF
jgi:hypothetical protein